MNPLNSVLLEGNVVEHPEVKHTGKGTAVCDFRIGSNRSWKSDSGSYENEVSFIDIKSWGPLAEACEKNCTKGRGVRVVGRLQQSRWKDNDGKIQSRLRVIAEHVEFKPERKKEEVEAQESASTPSAESDVQAMAAMAAAQDVPTQDKEEVAVF